MQAVLYVLSEGVGIVLAIHLAMNGQVGGCSRPHVWKTRSSESSGR